MSHPTRLPTRLPRHTFVICYTLYMKYKVTPLMVIAPLIAAAIAGFIADSLIVGLVIFLFLCVPFMAPIYVRYAADNPNHYWFKRKLYGWGWTPVTWQGWLVTGVYILSVVAFGLTIDDYSPAREIAFTFVIPALLLTIAFLRIVYTKGESPRWQWGIEDKTN